MILTIRKYIQAFPPTILFRYFNHGVINLLEYHLLFFFQLFSESLYHSLDIVKAQVYTLRDGCNVLVATELGLLRILSTVVE